MHTFSGGDGRFQLPNIRGRLFKSAYYKQKTLFDNIFNVLLGNDCLVFGLHFARILTVFGRLVFEGHFARVLTVFGRLGLEGRRRLFQFGRSFFRRRFCGGQHSHQSVLHCERRNAQLLELGLQISSATIVFSMEVGFCFLQILHHFLLQ